MAVLRTFQADGISPSTVGGSGTVIKYFPRPLGASIGVESVAPSATSAAGQLAVPGFNELNGQQFSVKATGSIGNDTGDPSGTALVRVLANIGTVTSPKYVTLGDTGTFTPGFEPSSWALNFDLYGDSNSGIVGGSFTAYVNGVKVSTPPSSLTNILTGINFNNNQGTLANASGGAGSLSGQPPFGLVCGVIFGTSDPSNIATLNQFMLTAN